MAQPEVEIVLQACSPREGQLPAISHSLAERELDGWIEEAKRDLDAVAVKAKRALRAAKARNKAAVDERRAKRG